MRKEKQKALTGTLEGMSGQIGITAPNMSTYKLMHPKTFIGLFETTGQ